MRPWGGGGASPSCAPSSPSCASWIPCPCACASCGSGLWEQARGRPWIGARACVPCASRAAELLWMFVQVSVERPIVAPSSLESLLSCLPMIKWRQQPTRGEPQKNSRCTKTGLARVGSATNSVFAVATTRLPWSRHLEARGEWRALAGSIRERAYHSAAALTATHTKSSRTPSSDARRAKTRCGRTVTARTSRARKRTQRASATR